MKPGYKTTEFWVTLATIILPVILPGFTLSPEVWVTLAGSVTAVYTAARNYAKTKHKE